MAYKCYECGHIFENGEERRWTEPHGERMVGCPICGGGYEETKRCSICDSAFLDDELSGGVCDDCIDENKYDIETCFSVGSKSKEQIEINCFLASIFSVEEVEEILFKELKEANKHKKINCDDFISQDRSWFGEMLSKMERGG